MRDALTKTFLLLRSETDKEFLRAKRLHGRRITCRIGCDACCRSPFSISELEAARISSFAASLPPPAKLRLQRRALAYLESRRLLFERHGFRESRGALAPPEQRQPCPALQDGRCAIYSERPLLCRRFGGPVRLPQYPDRLFACELNFPQGTTIEDERLNPAQQRLAERHEEVEKRFDASRGRRYHEPVTVAHALLEDFERRLP